MSEPKGPWKDAADVVDAPAILESEVRVAKRRDRERDLEAQIEEARRLLREFYDAERGAFDELAKGIGTATPRGRRILAAREFLARIEPKGERKP